MIAFLLCFLALFPHVSVSLLMLAISFYSLCAMHAESGTGRRGPRLDHPQRSPRRIENARDHLSLESQVRRDQTRGKAASASLWGCPWSSWARTFCCRHRRLWRSRGARGRGSWERRSSPPCPWWLSPAAPSLLRTNQMEAQFWNPLQTTLFVFFSRSLGKPVNQEQMRMFIAVKVLGF